MNMGHDNHDHSDMDMSMDPTSPSSSEKHWTHMTFFWGTHSEILFKGWPGARPGLYALALVILFALAVVFEWLNHSRLIWQGHAWAALMRTGLHAARMVLMYLIMLAVMSFNVGLLIVVVAGHAAGFFLFGSRRSRVVKGVEEGGEKLDLPPIGC